MMDDTARFEVDSESSSKDKTVGSTNLLVLKGLQEQNSRPLCHRIRKKFWETLICVKKASK